MQQKLAELAAAHRLRQPKFSSGINFASNDYLQMAGHPRLREVLARAFDDGLPVGAGAARLLSGNHPVIAECETHLAEWLAAEKVLLTSSGYQANYLLLSTLPQRGDVILYDANVHASARDGIRASAAQSFKFNHNDLDDLQRLIAQHQGAQIFIVTESLFSMDGDFADVNSLLKIAEQNNAILIMDEAHATGIFGATGKGCCESLPRDHLITVHTGGKALGAAGGFIAARADIIDYLVNHARPFIFSTAPMPVLALALIMATEILDEEPWRREKLLALCAAVGQKSPIWPMILGADQAALAAAEALAGKGYDVRAIRPPTVPEGSARLRISLNLSHSETDLADLQAEIAHLQAQKNP